MSMPDTELPAADASLLPRGEGKPCSESLGGCDQSFGALLQHCRLYLLGIAQTELPDDLRHQLAPSDLVQETFAEAIKGFDQFRGSTEAELRAWLRSMLLHNIADARKYFLETKRRPGVLARSLDSSTLGAELARGLAAPSQSPSAIATREESTSQLRAAIDRLPDDYRTVMTLRHFDGLKLADIGQRMGRSADAVRKLWFRAVEKLAEIVDDASAG